MGRRSTALLLVMLFLALVFCPQELRAEPRSALTLGVHPFLSATETINKFTPLAEYLSRKLNREVKIYVSKDYASHVERFASGGADIAFFGPASYVELTEKYGQQSVLAVMQVQGGKTTFQGVIFTRDASPIKTLSDLKGKRVAFGDAMSTMSHYIPTYMLIESGVNEADLAASAFLGNHDNVAMAVLGGEFDAGALKLDVFEKYKKKGARAVAYSDDYTEHLFAARWGLAPQTVEEIKSALLALAGSEEATKILTPINSRATGLMPVKDSDYDNLRNVLSTLKKHEVIK